MPTVSPFRGLRYAPAAGELADLISPPYDVIGPPEAVRLADRSVYNSVRLDLPQPASGEPSDARYAHAAAALAAWQADGMLVRDERPAVYVYEQRWWPPDATEPRVHRGFVARLGLEPFRRGGPVRPHERTLGGPKADRLALLHATRAILSPIIGLYRGSVGSTAAALHEVMAGPADATAVDETGVEHRLWAVPADDPARGPAVRLLIDEASSGPVTIADGHHRYETALTFQAERPGADTVMALLLDLEATEVTTLPTHRLIRGEPSGTDLLQAARRLFRIDPCLSAEALLGAMARPPNGQRLGVFSRGHAALLTPRAAALGPLLDPRASDASRWLDVAVLAAALRDLLGLDESAARGGAIGYTSDGLAAIAAVEHGDADSAFLLDPTPVEAVLAVAEAGELMPQKSTYFAPKPATGLVFDIGGT